MISAIALALAVIILAGAFEVFVSMRRRRRRAPAPAPVLPSEPHVNLGDAVREMLPLERQNDDEAVRDFQAEWLRDRQLITSDSVLATVQVARTSITHVGGEEVHAVLDDLQRQAAEHPEGVPGHVVANARLRFDELMRSSVQ
jgi:hypothetical protein